MSSLFDDTDDVSLRARRGEQQHYAQDHASPMHDPDHDREVTLNTGTVLALFFALVLVCAVFFGFGYSIGHKSGMTAAAASVPADTGADSAAATDAPATSSKPAPGSPAAPAVPGYVPPGGASTASPKVSVEQAAEKTVEPHTQPSVAAEPAAPIVRTSPPAAVTSPAASSASDTGVTTYVQIAAVSHQEDAEVLLAALTRRGYKVIQRSEPADKLIHVQIGPFASRKDAEVTRQRLLADGYNAFLK